MAVKRKYRLNLRNYGNLPAIMLSQYDEGYALEFEIRDGTDAASDLSAYTVTLKGTRADTLAYSFAGTVSTNVLTFVIDTTMTACDGRGTAEIAIKDTANDVLFATFNMPVFVERAAVPEGSIDADVERAQEIAEQVQEIVDNAAAAVSGEAERWATGQINGTDVPSTDPTYENNAKYYAERAETAAASIGIDATLTQTGKAADAKKTGDEISELKEDLKAIQSVDTSLHDGYLSSSTGLPVSPTADAQKYSDFIYAPYGSIFKAVVNLSEAKYRFIYVFAYDAQKNYVGKVGGKEGGSFSVLELETVVDNADAVYCRFGFNSYDVLDTYNVYVAKNLDKVIDKTIAPIKTEIENIKDLDNIRFQYLDASTWESGYYNWNSPQTGLVKNAGGENWFCLKTEDIPSGTYHYNKFCSLVFSFIENLSDGTFTKLGDIGITETTNGTVTISYPFRLWLSLNKVYFDRTTTMFASGNLPSSYVYGLYKDDLASYYVNAQGQKVWIVGNGYISTIQGACDMASANDIIFIRCGTYTEQVSIWNKKLHLIGENKANTILIDHSGAYNTPPLEMSLGSLSNMTIIEDGTQPTLQPGESGYNGAYCLHIEWTPPAGEVFRIDNCDFINYIHSPLGCGLYQDYTVHFKDCAFRCEATNEGNMERGSFYFHSNIQPNVTGQKIIAENCIISSAGQKWAVLLGVPTGANNTGSAEARFSGCTIWNDNLGTVDSIAYFDKSGGADVLKVVHSCGNTVDALNNW